MNKQLQPLAVPTTVYTANKGGLHHWSQSALLSMIFINGFIAGELSKVDEAMTSILNTDEKQNCCCIALYQQHLGGSLLRQVNRHVLINRRNAKEVKSV